MMKRITLLAMVAACVCGAFGENITINLKLPEGDAVRTDAEYVRDIALPFFQSHFVDSFDPSLCSKSDAADLLAMRKALALGYATTQWRQIPSSMLLEAEGIIGAKPAPDPGAVLLYATVDLGRPGGRAITIDTKIGNILKSKSLDPVMRLVLLGMRYQLFPNASAEFERAYCESVAEAFAEGGGRSRRLIRAWSIACWSPFAATGRSILPESMPSRCPTLGCN